MTTIAKVENFYDDVEFVVTGSGIVSSNNVEVYAKHLLRLEQTQGQLLTPEQVVQDARHPDSPLHNAFEWDDTEAARKYRLEQARHIVRSIKFVPRDKTIPPKVPLRVFTNVTFYHDELPKQRAYLMTSKVMNDDNLRRQILGQLQRDLVRMHEKYRAYYDLSGELQDFREVIEKTIISLDGMRGVEQKAV